MAAASLPPPQATFSLTGTVSTTLPPSITTHVAQKPSTLSREVLRWLQSLDLAYSIKNVKRDFCNGFLVAEIFSRYYDKDISMHSYDNGLSIRARKDNWKLLSKAFRRVGLSHIISEEEIRAIVYCKDGAIIDFLNRIYEVLTQRRVQEVLKRPLPEVMPPYARQTATSIALATMRDPQVLESRDQGSIGRVLSERVGLHEKSLQDERQLDPDRFLTESRAMNPAAAQTAKNKKDAPQVMVRDIQVKQIHGNVAQLRAMRDGTYLATHANTSTFHTTEALNAQEDKRAPPTTTSQPNPTTLNNNNNTQLPPSTTATNNKAPEAANSRGTGATGGGRSDNKPQESAVAIMNQCVLSRGRKTDLLTDSSNSNNSTIFTFVADLCDGQVADEVAVDVLMAIREAHKELCDNFLDSPSHFWKFSDVFAPLINELSEESQVVAVAVDTVAAIGAELCQRDVSTAANLLNDFLFPRLLPTIKQPNCSVIKTQHVLRMLYAFTPQDAASHYQMIKRVQVALDDVTAFVRVLASLIFLEKDFDETLLDYYLYYSIIGMGNPSPPVRASSLAMLSVLAQHHMDWVLDFLPNLLKMAQDDTWWEVQAQIILLLTTLLELVNDWEGNAEAINGLLDILFHVFAPSMTINVRKIGLSSLARFTAFSARLREQFITVLFSLPNDHRVSLLGLSEEPEPDIPLTGPDGGYYVVMNPALDWSPVDIVAEVENHIRQQSLDNFEPEHMQVLAAAVLHVCGAIESDPSTPQPLNQQWTEQFDVLRGYILVALADPLCCELAAEVIKRFVYYSNLQESILIDGTFRAILSLVHPEDPTTCNGDPLCQRVLAQFLIEVAHRDPTYATAIHEVLDTFCHRPLPEETLLHIQSLINEIAQQG